jgi:site-specific DNA-cytosine methylase
MTFIDWFAGVGGFRRGMELAGHKCVGFCEFDKFAVASYTSMHLITDEQRNYLAALPLKQRQKEILKDEYRNGEWYANDITRVCAADIPRADCWCAGFPCFVKGTLITTHRGQIPIEQIKSGDLVLTHKNRFKRVLKPMLNVKRGIYTLKVQGSPVTEVTGNHRFYVRDKGRKWNNSKRRYEMVISEPYWKEVQDFTGDELIQFPNNQKSENIYGLSELECWLIGRYVADGYIRDDERKDRPSRNQRTIICVGKNKSKAFEETIGNIKFCKSEERTAIKYVLHDKKLFSLCLQCGRGAENKCIPQFIIDLPSNLLIKFLDGYLSGDGSEKDGEYKATSVSKTLIYQLGQCIEKTYSVGYSIHYTKRPETCVIEERTVNQKDSWQIRFKISRSPKCLSFYIDDSLWMPVREISFNPKRVETVYNMEVEDDNSYTANNMGVHNCQDISVAGKQAGFQGNRSSLFFRLMYLVGQLREEDKPSFIFLENVKNLLGINDGWDFARLLVEMDKGGYDAGWQVLNSKDFGVPQNRERVFIIGNLRGRCPGEVFPVEGASGQNSIHLIGHKDGYRRNTQVFSPDGITEALDTAAGGGQRTSRGNKN